jgi:CDP-diacylglycerol--glycerol-3-phosphate 3-phosphatidyltransferase
MALNLPNQLSLARIILSTVLVIAIVQETFVASVVALLVFIVAGLTDYWDGVIARARDQKTPLGAFLDPLADKCLMLGAFWAFVYTGIVPCWTVVVITLREVAITLWRLQLHGVRNVGAIWSGKHKTVSQFATISVILLLRLVDQWWPAAEIFGRADIQGVVWLCLIWTVAMTVFSGLHLAQRWCRT